MPYSTKKTDMADFSFDQSVSRSTHDAAPYLPTSTRSSFRCSDGSLPYPNSTLSTNHDISRYYSMPEKENNWLAPEELSDEPYLPDTFCLPSRQAPGRYDPSYLEWTANLNHYSQHADLERITEFVKWESPPTEVKVEYQELPIRHPTSSFPSFDPYHPRSAADSHRQSDLSSVTSDGTKSRGRSEPSSPTETPRSKRRQSGSGRPVLQLPNHAELESKQQKASLEKPSPDKSSSDKASTNDSTSPAKSTDNFSAETAIPEPKPKLSTKASHSLIERKYRENLNSRIVLLDQTLASARRFDIETDASERATHGKTRKADVLNEAMRYVKQAELESEARIKEIDFLRLRVAALEKLLGSRDSNFLKPFAGSKVSQHTDS